MPRAYYDRYGVKEVSYDQADYAIDAQVNTYNSQGKAIPRDEMTYDENTDYTALKADINNHESELRKLMRANGVYEASDMLYWSTFYRFPRIDPFNYVDGLKEYDFFTKPDLPLLSSGNLTSEANNIPYFRYLYNTGYIYTVLENLCYSNGNTAACPFIRILSNRRSSNIDIPDIMVDELESAQNMYGTRILYPKSSMQSDENIDFSVEFEDTRYLEIYNLFKTWDIYRQLKWLGLIHPSQTYIENKILYDHIAVYKFLVDNDGETILHFSKWTGVFPKTISRSSFSEVPQGGPLKVTIGFKLSGWFEDQSPNILSDFNGLIGNWLGKDVLDNPKEVPIWDDEILAVSGESVDYPYIEFPQNRTDGGYSLPLLKWGKK